MAMFFGATQVAEPFEFERTYYIPGGGRQAASGRWIRENTQSSGYYKFVVRWRNLTTAELTAIKNEWDDAMDTQTSITMPDGSGYTAYTDPNSELIATMYLGAGGTKLWRAEAKFIERVPTS